jgi:predicted DNA repair protein MutK
MSQGSPSLPPHRWTTWRERRARRGAKAAGVVVDDTAVTPGYAMGFSPDRELPIVMKIAIGSLRNKLIFLLPGALLLSAFAPWLVTPILMLGRGLSLLRGDREDHRSLHAPS